MSKTLAFEYNGKPYVLEFNRATVKMMEKRGFNIAECITKPMNNIPKLVEGSFMMHHPDVQGEKVEEIFDHIENKSEFFNALVEMYNDTVESLLGDPAEGKTSWTRSW